MTTKAITLGDAVGGWVVEECGGAVILRHEAAAAPRPPDWRDRLLAALRTIGGAGAVGAKRLRSDGRIHAVGDFVIHPKGFHHLGHELPAEAFQFPEEVDAFSGGVVAIDRSIFERVIESTNGLQSLAMISLCLEIRRAGSRVLSAPSVIVDDSSTPAPSMEELARFRKRYGFDFRACDLDRVRERWGGGGLCWNARYFCEPVRYSKYEARPLLHWKMFEEVAVYRSRAEAIVNFIADAVRKSVPRSADIELLDLGCGDGLFAHLLVGAGFTVTGFDIEPAGIEQARQAIASREYPSRAPQFLLGEPGSLPFDNESVACVVMLDVIEHLPNPVAVLREVARVLGPGGLLAVSTPEFQYGAWSDPIFHVCEYAQHELVHQLGACGFAVETTARTSQPYRDIIAIARKL